MITVRPARARGHFDFGWLDTRHTFSFGDYYDPRHMGFRGLRVINEDRVQPGKGFGTHPHRDMEIVTYVLEGRLAHKDSMGTGSVIGPGDVQRMSAGTGVLHSEFNGSATEPVHFLQIWILPAELSLPPSYEQKTFDEQDKKGRLLLVGSRDGREGSITIHQDVSLYGALLDAGERLEHSLAVGRHAWIQVIRGALLANQSPLAEGDGAQVSDERRLDFVAERPTEFLVFDLA